MVSTEPAPPPPMKDLTTENITENVHIINSQCSDPRFRYLFERIAGIQFLTETGQISDDLRKEMILLSDVLGMSSLVDSINHLRMPPATEGTVLGPFHTHDAEDVDHGTVLPSDPDATRLLCVCSVKDTQGNPIPDVKVDVWEGDSKGFYDMQNPDRNGPDGRAALRSDAKGGFFFKAIVPGSYPIPVDGPVGKLLHMLGRHPNRPGHVHFMLDKPGYDLLVTALYPRGDPYETSGPVFGVKESLVIDLSTVEDPEMAAKYGVGVGTKLLTYDFVLLTEEDARNLRRQSAIEAMEKESRKIVSHNDLPVPAESS